MIKDKEIFSFIEQERTRQLQGLELIPSENYVSSDVLNALCSVLTNKYAEGYPGKRHYGGNKYIDEIEKLAIKRAKDLFKAEHVNVQPYSGSPANSAVYLGLLNFSDKLMGMSLTHGGHLTHGHKVSFSGRAYNITQYTVDPKTHLIDYDEIRKLAKREKPRLIISGATAYPRKINFKEFHNIALEVGAYSMADISHISGLVITDLHESPFPFTDVITTTTHKTLRGPRGAMIMCKEKFSADIDKAVFPGLQGGPHENTIAAIAVALKEASEIKFQKYAEQIIKNAKTLASSLQDYGFKLISDGTDNHLILIDLANKNIFGKEAETVLDKAGITVNKNTIPFDQRSPFDPSGMRLGTPAVTTRGMKESEMKEIALLISRAIENKGSEIILNKIKEEVKSLTKDFPLFKE